MLDTFDIVIEMTRAKLLSYILENVLIQSLPIVPKFLLKASGQKGSFQAILDQVDLGLGVGTNQAALNYHVYAATVQRPNQALLGFSDGEIHIKLKITPGAPFNVVLQSAEFETNQTSQINDPNSFFQDVNGILTGILDTKTEWELFPNTPSATAVLLLGLALNGQIACLDAETIVGAIGQGDIKKVSRFLKSEDFGVALSAERVKNTLLFPSLLTLLEPKDVANLLGLSLSDADQALKNPNLGILNSIKTLLPPPFGSGSIKQTEKGVDIFFDFIDFQLSNGFVKMSGRLHGEAFCAHIRNGAFEEIISLSMANQKLSVTFSPNPPQPTYSVEFDFWCALGFLFLASNVALVTGIVVTSITIHLLTQLTVQQKKLKESMFSVPAFDQVTWEAVEIFTEGLVLLGKSTAAVGFDTTISRVDISSSMTQINIEQVGSGTYHFPGNLACKAQDFKYEEYRQDVVVALFAQTTQLLFPVKTTWKVHGQSITGGSGQIQFTQLAHTATPPFNETALPNHQITIQYVVDPGNIIYTNTNGLTTLQLTIPKSNYNFGVFIELVVQDASGHTYSQPLFLEIETHRVEFGQDYLDFQKQCGLASKIKLSKLKTVPQLVLHGGEPLIPEQITNLVKEVIDQQPMEAIEIVKSLNATYGSKAILKAFSPK